MPRLAMVLLLALGSCVAAPSQDRHLAGDAPAPSPKYIGQAWMEADGSIRMNLRAESPSGLVGHAFAEYPPEHPEYKEILKHLGPMQPGDRRPVPAWRE